MVYACVSAWVDDDEWMNMNVPIFSYLFDVFCGSPEEEKKRNPCIIYSFCFRLFSFLLHSSFKKVQVRIS